MGGNHSIAAGIFNFQGEVIPTIVEDISGLNNYVYCDGTYYRRKDNNEIISQVKYFEFGIIFEIGRLMVEKNISF